MQSKVLFVTLKLCPYGQAIISSLASNHVDCDIHVLDPSALPEWLSKVTPSGKLPALKFEDKVLYEPTTILEFLNDQFNLNLLPKDPLLKAINRGNYNFIKEFHNAIRGVYVSKDQHNYTRAFNDLQRLLFDLEELLPTEEPYFNKSLGPYLVDYLFSSAFTILNHIQSYLNIDLFTQVPKTNKYRQILHSLPTVQAAVYPDYDANFASRALINKAYYMNQYTKPLLITFELCPFGQRVRTLLEAKGIEYNLVFVDLRNKPDWFLRISPTGRVPLLKIGDRVIFDSNVILEFIDEMFPPPLYPINPLEKAETRGWFTLANEVQSNYIQLWKSSNPDDIKPIIQKGEKLLEILENRINDDSSYFRGDTRSMINIAFCSVFKQMELYQALLKQDFYEKFPKVKQYSFNLLKMPTYQRTLVSGYDDLAVKDMQSFNSALLKLQ